MATVTLSDVAARCGVSRATVSLVLQDSHRVSARTKARVRQVLAEMNYVYDRRAANLRLQRSFTLGLVLTDIQNRALAELAMAVEDRANEGGCGVVMGYSRDSVSRQSQVLQLMMEQRLDGVVLSPASGTVPADLSPLTRSNTPFILVTRRIRRLKADYVGPNNSAGGDLIGEHLADLGVKRVAFVGGYAGVSARSERMKGVRKGLLRRGISWDPRLDIPSDAARTGGVEAVRVLLSEHGLPDAIVGYSDAVVAGVLIGLRRAGIRAGADVAVAGFDNSPEAAELDPPITSVSTFMERVGARATQQLLERVSQLNLSPDSQANLEPAIYLVDPELHVRASTADWRPDRSKPAIIVPEGPEPVLT